MIIMKKVLITGITGLAQIRVFYDLKSKHKIKYDYLDIQKYCCC